MNGSHFNQLSPAEAERLAVLAEECGEVIQAVTKILRHGYESTNPTKRDGETNREGLQRELGDLHHAASRMTDASDIDGFAVTLRAVSKAKAIIPYLHHQPVPPFDPAEPKGAKSIP